MVEGPLKNEQWQKHFAPGRTRDNIHGCLQARVSGKFESRKIGGRWIWEEKVDTHINMLEALQAFLPQLKQQHIQFGIDNKTAVAYINKLGGNPFTSSDISSLRDVEFCSRQKTNLVSSVCSQRGKSDCRQKVKGVSGQPGMDAASSSVSGIAKRSWLF